MTQGRCRIEGCKAFEFQGTYYCRIHVNSEGGVRRMTASRKLEEIFSSSLGGDELESAIASIPKRLDKFEGKWDQLVEWAEGKYGWNTEESRRARTSRKLEEIFSSSLGGDELESAIASIPKRLDKFEGKWDQLVEWAERKYGKGDRRISNVGPICEHDRIRARCRECWKLGIGGASSETNDVNHELGGISPWGTLLLLCSIVILFVPLTYENGNSVPSVSLLDAKGICSDGITAAFSGSVCSNVNDAFLAVVAMGLLGVYLNYTSVNYPSAGRSAPRNVSPGGGVKSKYCSECGTQFSGSEKFCSNCGSAR